jgi:hypothetical protein
VKLSEFSIHGNILNTDQADCQEFLGLFSKIQSESQKTREIDGGSFEEYLKRLTRRRSDRSVKPVTATVQSPAFMGTQKNRPWAGFSMYKNRGNIIACEAPS